VISPRRTVALFIAAAALFAVVFGVFTFAGQPQPPQITGEVHIGELAPPPQTTTNPTTTAPTSTPPPVTTVVPPPPPVGDDDDDDD
jgi:hypothetical protein